MLVLRRPKQLPSCKKTKIALYLTPVEMWSPIIPERENSKSWKQNLKLAYIIKSAAPKAENNEKGLIPATRHHPDPPPFISPIPPRPICRKKLYSNVTSTRHTAPEKLQGFWQSCHIRSHMHTHSYCAGISGKTRSTNLKGKLKKKNKERPSSNLSKFLKTYSICDTHKLCVGCRCTSSAQITESTPWQQPCRR